MIISVNRKKYYLYPVDNSIVCNKKKLSKYEIDELFAVIDSKIVSKFKMVVHMTNLRDQAIKNFRDMENEIAICNLKKLRKAN